MENVILVIHLLLALLLIGAVLIQRSEGGALGMGGGGNVMSGRSAATALQKATWVLGIAFFITSLILTLFATQAARDDDVLERLLEQPTSAPSAVEPAPPNIDDLLAPDGGAAPFEPEELAPPAPAPAPPNDG